MGVFMTTAASAQSVSQPAAAGKKPELGKFRDFEKFVFSRRDLASEPISPDGRAKIESDVKSNIERNISNVRLSPSTRSGEIHDYRFNDPQLLNILSNKNEIVKYSLEISHRFEHKMFFSTIRSTLLGMGTLALSLLLQMNPSSIVHTVSQVLGVIGGGFLLKAIIDIAGSELLNHAWSKLCSEYTQPGFLKVRVEAAVKDPHV